MHMLEVVLIVLARAVNAAPSFWRGGTLWPDASVVINSITGKPCNQQGIGHGNPIDGCPAPRGGVANQGYGHSTPNGPMSSMGLFPDSATVFYSRAVAERCKSVGERCPLCCRHVAGAVGSPRFKCYMVNFPAERTCIGD